MNNLFEEPKMVHVTWEDVENFVNCIRNKYLLENQPFSGVYGLPRGGLIPAVLISHKMGLPLLSAPHPHCLIVDDICDSGESLLHYFNNSSGDEKLPYTIVTMYYKPNKHGVTPDFYYREKPDNSWIVFPWEWK